MDAHANRSVVFWFSQLEGALRLSLANALELPGALHEAVTASYDFRTLCDVTLAACRFRHAGDRTKVAAIETLIPRCKAINDIRVRIVHGTWQPASAAGLSARHMSRQTLRVNELFNDPQELKEAVQKCLRLSQEVIFFEALPGG
jgi:hypothetical protein